jgi:hypothetical protein
MSPTNPFACHNRVCRWGKLLQTRQNLSVTRCRLAGMVDSPEFVDSGLFLDSLTFVDEASGVWTRDDSQKVGNGDERGFGRGASLKPRHIFVC